MRPPLMLWTRPRPVRVGDHAADQAHRLLRLLRLRDGGADVEQALARLGHEHGAVRQAARGVARREGGLRLLGSVVVPLMGEGVGRRDDEHDERQARRRAPASCGSGPRGRAGSRARARRRRSRRAWPPRCCRAARSGCSAGLEAASGRAGAGAAATALAGSCRVPISRSSPPGAVTAKISSSGPSPANLADVTRVGAVGGGLGLDLLVAADGDRDLGVGHRLVRGEPVEVKPKTVAAEDADELVGVRLSGDPRIVGGDRSRRRACRGHAPHGRPPRRRWWSEGPGRPEWPGGGAGRRWDG